MQRMGLGDSDVSALFDRTNLVKKRSRAFPNKSHFLVNWVQTQFTERMTLIKRDFHTVGNFSPDNDPFDELEVLQAKKIYDCVTSALHLHTINDLPGALIQIKRSLVPDGLFMGAVFGDETLNELRQCIAQTEIEHKGGISPRMHPLTTKQDMGALMQRAAFALPVVDSERVTVSYMSFEKLIQDLRMMGETNVLLSRHHAFTGRQFWHDVAEKYKASFSVNGALQATFDIIFMLGWAPDDSQPKPLPRGSGKVPLGDVL